MSLKYSNTTADFLQWDEAMNLIRKLFKDGNYNMSLLVALGCFFGLRISDILALRWNQILTTAKAYCRLLQGYPAIRQKFPYLGKSERHGLFYTTDKYHSERTEKEVQAAYRQFQLPFP